MYYFYFSVFVNSVGDILKELSLIIVCCGTCYATICIVCCVTSFVSIKGWLGFALGLATSGSGFIYKYHMEIPRVIRIGSCTGPLV